LRKKLKVKRFQLIPFVVQMADQWKVKPIGLTRNLNINLASCDYKISNHCVENRKWSICLFHVIGMWAVLTQPCAVVSIFKSYIRVIWVG
jgi:hypothetical protein